MSSNGWWMHSGANIIIDGQWGSCGKGKLASVIGDQADVCSCDFMPNAGHTVYRKGEKLVFKQLPSAAAYCSEDAPIIIGPGSVIDMECLEQEYNMIGNPSRVLVDYRATILDPKDAEYERENLKWMGSTMKGCGAAQSRKMLRLENSGPKVSDVFPKERVIDASEWYRLLGNTSKHGMIQAKVFVETSQGFNLSMNHGMYPHTTSRDCTVSGALDRNGIPLQQLGAVFGIMRTFPIRVGGPSGPCWKDQQEITFADIPSNPEPELTTVTKRVRRIFTWSGEQFDKFLWYCGPDYLMIAFADYLVPESAGSMMSMNEAELSKTIDQYIAPWLNQNVKPSWKGDRNVMLSYGPDPSHTRYVNINDC